MGLNTSGWLDFSLVSSGGHGTKVQKLGPDMAVTGPLHTDFWIKDSQSFSSFRTLFTFSPTTTSFQIYFPKSRAHLILRFCPQQELLSALINSFHDNPQIVEGRLGWPEQEIEKGKDIYLNSIHSELIHGSCYRASIWFFFQYAVIFT